MKPLKIPSPVILFSAVLATDKAVYDAAVSDLTASFGMVAGAFGPRPFTHTNYYTPEMGDSLIKGIVAFEQRFPPGRLAEAKLTARSIERRYLRKDIPGLQPCRRVNIDPGLLTLSHVILATGKNFSHRIYIGSGVYAEVTLIYHKSGWECLPWTYPDFKDEEVQDFLTTLRHRL